jgi:hypothetical protein
VQFPPSALSFGVQILPIPGIDYWKTEQSVKARVVLRRSGERRLLSCSERRHMAEPMDVNARVERIDEKLDRLSASVDARFTVVDERFQQVDGRFQQVDGRFQQVDARFQQVDERFVAVLKLIADEGRDIRRYVEQEGQKTRRHFDVVAEQMKSERNLAIDKAIATDTQLARLTATNAADHVSFDSRLNQLEKQRE